MANDKQQATVTLQAKLGADFNKSFDNAIKKVTTLEQKLKGLNSVNAGIGVSSAKASQSIGKQATSTQRVDLITGQFVGTTNKLSASLNTQAVAGQKVDLITGQISQSSNKAAGGFNLMNSGIVRLVAGYLTLQAAAAGANSILKTTAEFSGKISELKATLDGSISPQQLDQLTAMSKTLSMNSPFNSSEIASGMIALGKAGLETNDILAATNDVMNLAIAGSISFDDAAQNMTDTMNQFGLKASDAAKITDTLIKAANLSTVDVGNLMESLKYLGPQASILGEDLTDVAGFIGFLGNYGLKGGMATRAFASRLAFLSSNEKDLPDDARKALRKTNTHLFQNGEFVGLDKLFKDLEKGMQGKSTQERIALANDIFGPESGRAVNAALLGGSKALEEFIVKVRDAGGAGQRFKDIKMDSLQGDLQKLGNSFGVFALTLGEIASPALRTVVQELTKDLQTLNDMLKNNVEILGKIFAFNPNKFIVETLFPTTTAINGSNKVSEESKDNLNQLQADALQNAKSFSAMQKNSSFNINSPLSIAFGNSGNDSNSSYLIASVQRLLNEQGSNLLKNIREASSFESNGSTY